MKNNHTADKITIKGSAEKEIIYHYNREERLKGLKHSSAALTKKRFFSKNKVLMIIIMDIILLIIIFLIFRCILYNAEANKNLYGYSFSLSSFHINDKAFLKVKIKKTHEIDNENPVNAKIRFYQEYGNSVIKEVILPDTLNESIDIPAALLIRQGNDKIHAEVSIKDNSFILSAIPEDR